MEAWLLDDRADPRQRFGTGLRNRSPEQAHRPGARRGEAKKHPDQRRLAGPVGSQVPERDTAGHAKIDAVDDNPVAEPLLERTRFDHKPGAG